MLITYMLEELNKARPINSSVCNQQLIQLTPTLNKPPQSSSIVRQTPQWVTLSHWMTCSVIKMNMDAAVYFHLTSANPSAAKNTHKSTKFVVSASKMVGNTFTFQTSESDSPAVDWLLKPAIVHLFQEAASSLTCSLRLLKHQWYIYII